MKKLIFTLISVILLATSCSLEKMPSGSVNTNDVQSIDDVSKLRNYLYIRLRGMYAGSYISCGELMSDLFHASLGYGNRGGIYHKWQWTATESLAESLWSHGYYTTASANFIMQEMDKLKEKIEFTDAEKAQLDIYYGECHFMKAAAMFELVKMFAETYTSNPNALGVMLVDTYNPTSDQTVYPGRSTVAEVYQFIDENLNKAASKLSAVENAEASIYLTPDAIKAFQARVALYKGDYATAASLATSLIDSGRYPLIDNVDDFNMLWTNDSGKECMMQLWADYASGSLPSSLDYSYISLNASGIYSPDYLPEQWIVDLYSEDDIRSQCWFEEHTVTYNKITGNAVLFTKFPGNRALQDAGKTTSDYINKIKLFRIAEQYLIAAEAYASMGGNEAAANQYLNALRAARINNYVEEYYAGEALINAIKDERVRELIGEGYRFYDLKRYNKGFSRGESQNDELITNANSTQTELFSAQAGDFRFLWPIPQAEIDSNPQISEQQNPGY